MGNLVTITRAAEEAGISTISLRRELKKQNVLPVKKEGATCFYDSDACQSVIIIVKSRQEAVSEAQKGATARSDDNQCDSVIIAENEALKGEIQLLKEKNAGLEAKVEELNASVKRLEEELKTANEHLSNALTLVDQAQKLQAAYSVNMIEAPKKRTFLQRVKQFFTSNQEESE